MYDTESQCSTSAGDLIWKHDAMGNATCFAYDALHRNTSITYPVGSYHLSTAIKTFVYDSSSFSCPNGSNLKGRLAEAYTGSASSKTTDLGYCYSPRGEIIDLYDSTLHSGGYYHIPITYWANGLVNTFGPFLSQNQQTYAPDGEGRVGAAGGFTPTITYNAASQPTQLMTSCNSGTCYPITYTYDPNTSRMTQYSVALHSGTISGTMNWNPNGSLQSLTTSDSFNAANNQTCTYSDDDLSRILGVNCGSTWAQTFGYDPFGNLTKSGSISWQPGYNQSTNRYIGSTSYDADGNLLKDTFNTYTWDTDGKNLSTTYGNNAQVWSFIYDAFGHQAELSINGTYSTSYLALGNFKLSANGQSPNYSEYPLPGGSILSQGGGATGVQMADWLGTIRAFYSYTGGNYERSSAHAPFGETYALSSGYPIGFAGQGFDDGSTVNTTYWFPERRLRSSQGRWLSPDPAGLAATDPSNPQSWNRYAYALNNPLSNIDPTGKECVWDDGSYDSNNDPDTGNFGDCANAGGTWIGHDIFANSQYYQGDWTSSGNDGLSGLVYDIQSCVAAAGGGQAASLLIADAFASGFSNDQTAYVLATAQGETNMGASMTENITSTRANRAYGGLFGNNTTGDGYLYRGRGYAQLTYKAHYQYFSNELGADFVQNPSLAANPDLAAQIEVEGLDKGSITGVSLNNYVNSGGSDFYNARRTVNGINNAPAIAGYAQGFANSLQGCR